jgi:hypothetical protein
MGILSTSFIRLGLNFVSMLQSINVYVTFAFCTAHITFIVNLANLMKGALEPYETYLNPDRLVLSGV